MNPIHHFSLDGSTTQTIEVTSGLKDKWTAGMLDQSGSGYSGSFRLDFTSCDELEVVQAVAKTLSRHPILAASFDLKGGELVGEGPLESDLYDWMIKTLSVNSESLDEDTFKRSQVDSITLPGLKVAKTAKPDHLSIWIGFWTFTCDGLSIDLLTEEIFERLTKKAVRLTHKWKGYEKAGLTKVSPIDKARIYPESGPYGIDSKFDLSVHGDTRGESFPFSLSINTKSVEEIARGLRTTPFMLTFSAFQKAVSEVSEISSVVTGIPFSNRLSEYEMAAIGPFSNTISVTTTHSDRPFFEEANLGVRALIEASKRQRVVNSNLYPDYLSHRSNGFTLPFAQIFNAWNSKKQNQIIALNEGQTMCLKLLHNNTARAGFEVTLDDNHPAVFGRIDMNKNIPISIVKDILKQMDYHLASLIKKD
ncbi:hypothetical protein CKF94_20305 [Vibrio coralliilyticus]|uniref:non-ribosomal peptide synthetase n=1 Tax=Vibrio coralliilyticus TaxID=190893 RepID=UPI000BAB20DE|nr:non-ribosomal peptide synthetase [Vibrio coralliilyticus]MCC2524245.1 non-ribosomal peptide synthetase [Vibrio coralliilyticus]PAU36414.1 hypothetical protein CKF94_20305 [Vibrio coralliilyticus]